MIGDDELLSVVQQWVQKAENDLKNAAYTLRIGKDCPTDTVCFHAQQCQVGNRGMCHTASLKLWGCKGSKSEDLRCKTVPPTALMGGKAPPLWM
jgi:hypothetical protein